MGRKADLRQVDRIARAGGLTDAERYDFGDYLEECKSKGDRGTLANGDFTEAELREKLVEFQQGLKRFRR